MQPDTMIAARPHFRQEGNQLYFFLSERVFRSLSPGEATIWEKLKEGPLTLKDLPDQAAVRSLAQSGLVEAIRPINQHGRRPFLVIEPHCDDAALSIGATMWRMRNEVEFHLLTMASRSNYTTAFHMHRNYFNRRKITAMRMAEGDLFSRHLGGHYYCADLAEATLRYNDSDWDLDFFNAHEVPIAISNNRRAPRVILDTWVEHLRIFLGNRTFDEIWLPLGAGTHADHDLARNAALEVIADEHPRAVVRLYEDVPYGSQFQEHTERILEVLRQAGTTLTPWHQDVTTDFASKLSLLNIFASQFKVSSVQEGVERSARVPAADERIERLWTVEALPDHLPEDEMWIGAPGVSKTTGKLRKFRKNAGTARRLAIFAISAAGRWREDLQILSRLFPAAKFIVYAGPRVCAELLAVEDGRVDLRCLDGRSRSWLMAALREAVTGHRIIVAGDALKKADRLMMLWPTGRKIACAELDHLIQALAIDERPAPVPLLSENRTIS